MKRLLDFFIDLCLLRATPQQLPASPVLFWLSVVAELLAGTLLISGARAGVFAALLETLVDVLLLLLLLYLALQARNLTARFLQSATALLGASALLSLLAMPLLALSSSGGEGSGLAALAALLLLALIIWNMVVLGHILRHALRLSFAIGIALAFAYTSLSYMVLYQLFPAS